MYKLLLIATGGAVGALLRYLVSAYANDILPVAFPWSTLAVNLIGCLIIGLIWPLAERLVLSPYVNAFIFIGLLGAFTTFSTYGLETIKLIQNGEIILALANIGANNIIGLAAVMIGKAAAINILAYIKF